MGPALRHELSHLSQTLRKHTAMLVRSSLYEFVNKYVESEHILPHRLSIG